MTIARLTPWFPHDAKPVRVGVYRTGNDFCANAKDDCGAYAFWDGSRWCNYGRWADYHHQRRSGFWWRGLDRKSTADEWRVDE